MTHKDIDFFGHKAVELTTPALRLAAVYEHGPRIAFFGTPDGENLLHWEPHARGRNDWDLMGGHRVWVTRPGADESEESYRPDNEPAHVHVEDNGFTVTGALDPCNLTRRGMRVRVVGDCTVEVDNFVTNEGDMLYSGGVWALTCTAPKAGTRYAAPLGDGSRWDNFHVVYFRRWAGNDALVRDPQFTLTEELLLIEPHGRVNKRMLLAPLGVMAMSDPARGVTFAKRVAYEPRGAYPLGTNQAWYIGPDNFMVEMETMGPAATLKPGQTLHHVETWTLRPGARDFATAAEVLGLF
jgi:hypothetical protein